MTLLRSCSSSIGIVNGETYVSIHNNDFLQLSPPNTHRVSRGVCDSIMYIRHTYTSIYTHYYHLIIIIGYYVVLSLVCVSDEVLGRR